MSCFSLLPTPSKSSLTSHPPKSNLTQPSLKTKPNKIQENKPIKQQQQNAENRIQIQANDQ